MKEKHDAIQNLFALVVIFGFCMCIWFQHVSEVVWWIGALMLIGGGIGIYATDYFYERKEKENDVFR